MALLRHVIRQMALRYATLASPTLQVSSCDAMSEARRRLPLVTAGRATPPSKVEWLHAEFVKACVAPRPLLTPLCRGSVSLRNIGEQCDDFVPALENTAGLAGQFADIRGLHAHVKRRGWDNEAARHPRVISKLEDHLATLQPHRPTATAALDRPGPTGEAGTEAAAPGRTAERTGVDIAGDANGSATSCRTIPSAVDGIATRPQRTATGRSELPATTAVNCSLVTKRLPDPAASTSA